MLDKHVSEYLKSFGKLALAVSGGRDSMALLAWFCKNISKKDFFVITIHHNLRDEEGRRDRDFVRDYCVGQGVECRIYEEDIPTFCKENSYGVEQGARIRRRAIFADTVKNAEAERVVTAHHMQDQVESILMHIFRGSGIKGLRGMSLDDGVLLRPMLQTSREQVEKFIADNSIPYVDDSSNDSDDYTRNKLRNVILPLIRESYPSADGNIIRLSKRADEMCRYADGFCRDYSKKDGEVYICVEVLRGERVIAANTIINAVDEITTRVDLTSKHIDAVLSLVDKPSGASVDLPFALTAHKEGEYIVLAVLQAKTYSGIIEGYGEYDLSDRILLVCEDSVGRLRCDMDKLCGCEIRNRRTGDTFKRYKGKSKSLGDYLTDIKAPKRKRENIVVLAKGSEVYALPEYEISDRIKVDESTSRVAYLDVVNK